MTSTAAQTRLLLRNDFRLLVRGLLSSKHSLLLSGIIMGVGLILFHAIAIAVFSYLAAAPTIEVQAMTWAFFIFMMLGAAMANAIRLLFDHNDLDLLFASPLSPRAVLLSRILSLFLGSLLSTALIVLPLINGAIIGISRRFAAAYPTWIFLALISASVGTSTALALVRLMGPRRARTWVQVFGAVVGAAVYLAFQSSRFIQSGEPNQMLDTFKTVINSAPGRTVARAGNGSWIDLLFLGGIAVVCTAFTARLLSQIFLSGVQESVSRSKKRTRSHRRHRVQAGLFNATLLKELRLIRRDPLLLTQILPSVMYVAPALFGFRSMGGFNLLAPLSVIVGVQFSMLLTGVAVDGEEGLDLIRSSPLSEIRLRTAKIAAAMSIPLFIAFLLCSAVAVTGRPGLALIAFLTSVGTAAACGWLRSSEIRPSPRSDILKRRGGHLSVRSISSGILMFLATATVGVFAADVIPLLGAWLLGVNALGILACFVLVSPKEFSELPESA